MVLLFFSISDFCYCVLMLFDLGMFSNYIFNSEDKVVMKVIIQVVFNNKVDLGIIFDIDVDR